MVIGSDRKFHVTATGDVKICKAKNRCPLSSWDLHFETKEKALKGAEEYLELKGYSTFGSNVDEKLQKFSRVRRGLNGFDPETKSKRENFMRESRLNELGLSDKVFSVVKWYQGTSYQFVNSWLRKGRDGLAEYMREEFLSGTFGDEEKFEAELKAYVERAEKAVKEMDEALRQGARTATNKRVLYRAIGVKPDEVSTFAERYKIGEEIEEPSYLSSSEDSDVMLLHESVRNKKYKETVVFEILTNKGTAVGQSDGYHVSGFEKEVLLPRSMKFRVVGIGESTFESTYSGGRPQFTVYRDVPKRKRFKIVQLEEIES